MDHVPLAADAGLPEGARGDIGVSLRLLSEVHEHMEEDAALFFVYDGYVTVPHQGSRIYETAPICSLGLCSLRERPE